MEDSTLPSPHSLPELGPGHSSEGFLEGFEVKGTVGRFHSEFPITYSRDSLYSTWPTPHLTGLQPDTRRRWEALHGRS